MIHDVMLELMYEVMFDVKVLVKVLGEVFYPPESLPFAWLNFLTSSVYSSPPSQIALDFLQTSFGSPPHSVSYSP